MPLNEIKQESVTIKNEEFSNPSSPYDLLNANIKSEFVDEIIKPDIENQTEIEDKAIETSGTEKNVNENDNVLSKKLTITESNDIEMPLNEIKQESITIKNEVQEFSNPSSPYDSLNASIKSEFDDEIIKPDIENATEIEDKAMETSSTEKNVKEYDNGLSKKLTITESINIEMPFDKNHSSPEDLLNANIKSDADQMQSECELSKMNYEKNENVITFQLSDESLQNDTLHFAHTKQHPGSKYACKACNKHFECGVDLITHMEQHTDNNCICNVCNRRFKHPKNLASHLYIHTNFKPYSCYVCGKKYIQASTLVVHMRLHTGWKPFSCYVCDRRFRDGSTLKEHMTIHTDEKPHKCDICGKTMARRCYLISHLKTHIDEKPFKCSECDRAFSTMPILRRHSFVHTKLKPFSCDVCKKSFKQKGTLKAHAKRHTNERCHV